MWTLKAIRCIEVKVSYEVSLGSFDKLVAANEKAIANHSSFRGSWIPLVKTPSARGHLTPPPMSTQPSLGKSPREIRTSKRLSNLGP
jgi:hypothetical protein